MTGTTFRAVYREGAVHLRLPIFYRLVFVLLAAVTIAAMVAAHAFNVFPFVLLALIVAVALFDERWTFERSNTPARRSVGVLFSHRTHAYAADTIDCLELVHFMKGSPATFPSEKLGQYKRHQVGLYLRLVDGTRIAVETRPSDHPLDLTEIGRDIARVSGLKLETSP